MATAPHPDLPTILRALTLMTWELPSWKIRSFGKAASWGARSLAFWSPLLHSRAPSTLAWGHSGTGVSTCEDSAGRGGKGQW